MKSLTDRIARVIDTFDVCGDTIRGGRTVWLVLRRRRLTTAFRHPDYAAARAECNRLNALAVIRTIRAFDRRKAQATEPTS